MGWFSNPNCPKCGRETTPTGYSFPFPQYRCKPCIRQAKSDEKKDQEIEDLKRRLDKLENKS